MKRLFGTLTAAILSLGVCGTAKADIGTSLPNVLTSFDFNIVGLGLKADPPYQAVPKGIASRVNALFDTGLFNAAEIIAQLPKDYTVRAELSGPSLLTPMQLVTRPGSPFDLPTLAIFGKYYLSNIRLCDGSGNTLFGAIPQAVAIESIPDPLITSVTTRQLTVQELQERGVTFDSSNFTAYQFTVGIATSSGQIPLTLPVIIPTGQTVQETPDLVGATPISIPQPDTMVIPPDIPETALPRNLVVEPFMMEVLDKEVTAKYTLPPISGVMIIPGNIGFLHQYFSAMMLVANGAPLQSNLVIKDVQTKILFPAGEDLVPGSDAFPGDDPLRMAKGVVDYFPQIMSVMNAGPDGKNGTSDDVGSLRPAESGQADFTIEGLQEGTHKLDFEITATLEGLPIGPVTLKGKASGAVLVRNPDFAITLGHPATVRAGEQYDLFVTVSNTGKGVANLVSVGLDPRALSGAAFVDGETGSKEIETILPGSAGTVKFRLKSQRTGKVTATVFESTDVRGRFILRAGVGENGIPLSPDSLILPYTGNFNPELVTSAVGLLGQAWSVATAPAGALPSTVLPITKGTVSSRAYEFSEAGLRVLIGDSLVKAVEDLTFDFLGSDVYNKGFDSLRRSSSMGLDLNRAIAAIYKTEIDATGAIPFQAAFADKVSYRPGHLSIVTSAAPLRLQLTDSSGNRTGALDVAGSNRGTPYADSFPMGENGSSRAALILATRLDTTPYTLELAAEGTATFDMGIVLPDATGTLTQYVFSSLSLPAGAKVSLTITPGSSTLQLAIDDNGDGAIDRTINPSATNPLPDHAPHIVAATRLVPDFGPGGDKHGRNVAVLFSERVTKESAQLASNYGVDENLVKQATIQPGNRMAFLLLREGIGPFIERNLTAQGLTDQSGRAMTAPESLKIRITPAGPAAIVTGTVRTARGEPVPNATIRLYQFIWYTNLSLGIFEEPWYALFTEKQANADGSYRLEYVLQNDSPTGPFKIEAVNPATGEVGSLTTSVIAHGQQLTLDIFMKAKGSLSGVVKNEAGNLVSGATVQVITLADNRGKSIITDASGSFSFTGLMVGAYNLKAVSEATLSEGGTMGILPEDGSAVVQDLTIRRVADIAKGSVSGKVLAPDGVSPRSGVIVIIEKDSEPKYKNWQRSTADGSYSFSGVYAGVVTVKALDDVSGEQSVVSGTVSNNATIVLNVIMKGTGSVKGTVTRDDGKSPEGLYVIVSPSQGQKRVLRTDVNGAFLLEELPTGNVGVEILDPKDFNRTVASGSVTILSVGDTADIALFVPLKALSTGTIQGTVYRRNGTIWPYAPLHQIVNDYHYYARQAGSDGKFSIPNLALGNYRFSVVSGNEVINVSTDLWYDMQVRTLELRPLIGAVTGSIYDDAARTIPTGADVTLYSAKPNMVGWLTYDDVLPTVVKSDPKTGRFTFSNVLLGSFTVKSSNIFRPTPVTAGGSITSNGQVVTVDLSLKGSPPAPGEPPVNQPGSISGQALMPDGTPVGAGVSVSVSFGDTEATVSTYGQGQFMFAPLIPAGNHTITAEDMVSTLKWKGNVTVPSGLDVPITIKLLGRGSITVKVLDGGGLVVPNANITVKGTGYPNDEAVGASDAAGQALFTNLSEGSYAVSASGTGNISILSGRNQVSIPGDNASVTVEVRLASSATVTGRFLKADGITAIPGGQITLKRNNQAIAFASSSSDPSDPGRFRMDYVPLGDFVVEGFDPITERRGIGGGRLNVNGETVSADVVVTPRGTVKGTVLNYGGSTPLSAAPISISFNGGAYSSVTGTDGTFLFTGIAAGQFTLNATDPVSGLRGTATGSLSYENETVQSQVRTAPIGSISGRVLMPDGITVVTIATVSLNNGVPTPVNADGIFRYDNLAAGSSYTLTTSQQGVRRTGSTVVTISRDLEVANGDIILGGVGSVAGVVFEADGSTLLSGAKVELRFKSGQLTVYTGSDGGFSFTDIPTGSFTLTASHTLRTTGASKSGYLASEGQTFTQNLVLGPVGSVKATVLLADGVTLSRGGGIRISTTNGNNTNTYTGITDSNGQYTFTNIPVPCSVSLYVEDAAGVGIGRFFGVLDTNGQVLATGPIVLDDKPISVIGINPDNGAVNIPINQTMRVLFSEPADPSTLNSSNIYLTQMTTRVAGTLQIDNDNKGVTFIPAAPLKGFTLYNMVVSSEVRDLAWHKLALSQTVSFTTVDNLPPTLISISPANGVIEAATDTTVRATFSEPLDPASLDSIKLSRGTTVIPTRIDLIQSGAVVVLTPLEALASNSVYSVLISGVKDLVGNVFAAPQSSTFNTIDTMVPIITALTMPVGSDLIKGNAISVTARTPDSDVALVDFFADDVRVKSISSAPFTMLYTIPKEGIIHLKAIAQDKAGNRGIPAFLNLNVIADTPPLVVITAPAEGSSVSTGATLNVTVQATDDQLAKEITLFATGEITSTQTRSAGTGKSYITTFTLTVPATITKGGNIQLAAIAKDGAGNTSSQAVRTVTVYDGSAPAVSITKPLAGTKVKPGETITVEMAANDNVGITSVRLVATGAVVLTEDRPLAQPLQSTTATFSFTVPDTAGANATIRLIASAQGTSGNRVESAELILTVADLAKPGQVTVAAKNGASEAYRGKSFTTVVNASDNVGVSTLTLTIQGAITNSLTRQFSPPVSPAVAEFTFSVPADAPEGSNLVMTATAADASGNSASSSVLTVLVVTKPSVAVISVAPVEAVPVREVEVVVTAVNTSLQQGVTKASFGAGIRVGGSTEGTLGSVTVDTPQTFRARVAILPSAEYGARDISIQTLDEIVIAAGRFTVVPAYILAPEIQGPLASGSDVVRVVNVAAGATVQLFSGATVLASKTVSVGMDGIDIEVAPLNSGEIISARQVLAGHEGHLSANIEVGAIPAAPVIVKPLFVGIATVRIIGVSGGAMVKLAANGQEIAQAPVPLGSTSVEFPAVSLGAGAFVTATQTLGSIQGPAAKAVMVRNAVPPIVEGPLAVGVTSVTVGNVVPGATAKLLADGVEIGSAQVPTGDEFVHVMVGALIAGANITAVQVSGGVSSPASTVVQVGAVPPAPTVRGPLFAGGRFVVVTGVSTGATVNLRLNGSQVASVVSVNGRAEFVLSSGLTQGALVTANQVVGGVAGTESKAVQVVTPAVPIILEPIGDGARVIAINNPIIGADQLVTVNDQVVGAARPVRAGSVLDIPVPARAAGETVSVAQVALDVTGPVATSTVAGNMPAPPVVQGPLFSGGRLVRVSGVSTGAVVELRIDGTPVGTLAVPSGRTDADLLVAPTVLVAGVRVTAIQTIGAHSSNPSSAVLVNDPVAPLLPDEVTNVNHELTLSGLSGGGLVVVEVNGIPVVEGVVPQGQSTLTLALPVIQVGDAVTAYQGSFGVVGARSPARAVLKALPLAKIAAPGTTTLNSVVNLDGSGSTSPYGRPLSYRWAMTDKPLGSTVSLLDGNEATNRFIADKHGSYQVSLVVNDGLEDSQSTVVTITTQNIVPVANAGQNRSVLTGDTVTLNGSQSRDQDGDPLSYTWQLLSVPVGGQAVLSSLTAVSPTFIADVAGSYVIELLVNDGMATSTPATVTVNATARTFSFQLSMLTIRQGETGQLNLTLSHPAPAGGFTVNLTSQNPAQLTVPASVTIPEAGTSAQVGVSAVATGAFTDVNVTVSAQHQYWTSSSATVTVKPLPTVNLQPVSLLTTLNTQSSLTVSLTEPAPTGGLIVNLAADITGILSFPSTVTISAGATQAQVSVTALAVGTTTLRVTAQSGGFISGTASIITVNPSNVATGSLITGCWFPMATLLNDGTVLIAGGGNGSPLSRAEIYDPSSGYFSATGSMNNGRDGFNTATLLPNGKVLIAGGSRDVWPNPSMNSAEVYDPTSKIFTSTSNMNDARHAHTATLLTNGKVLVTGGSNDKLSSAELYDPAINAFTRTGNMITGRYAHSATRLSDGRVLIVGGATIGGVTTTAELYDPATGLFTATGSLNTAHGFHTATLLSNGKVLIAGGGSNSSCELYDPATGTFAVTGSLNVSRYYHRTVLLMNGKVLIIGGENSQGRLSSMELYDPDTGKFTPFGNLKVPRSNAGVALISSDKILVAGGYDGSSYLNSAELIRLGNAPAAIASSGNLAFSTTTIGITSPSQAVKITNFGTADLQLGTMTFTGSDALMFGFTAGGTCGTVLAPNTNCTLNIVFTPASGGVKQATLNVPTNDPGKQVLTVNLSGKGLITYPLTVTIDGSGEVHSSPGSDINCLSVPCTQLYDSDTSVQLTATPAAGWTFAGWSGACSGNDVCNVVMDSEKSLVATFVQGVVENDINMITARSSHTATLLPNGKVLIAGGYNNGGRLRSAELYDPAIGAFMSTGAMASERCLHTATLLANGKVLIAGGWYINGSLSSAELFDPATGTFMSTGAMTSARVYHTATLLPNGKVLIAGGHKNVGDLRSAELYDPATGTFTSIGNMNTGRTGHTATLLPNGQVLIAGGFDYWNALSSASSAELYDPATGSFISTSAMTSARINHTDTLLQNGKVLIVGGDNHHGNALSSAELYDPATKTFTSIGNMAIVRTGHTATLLPSGQVIIAGGYDGSGSGSSNAVGSKELYDPEAGIFMGTSAMFSARMGHTATLMSNGQVLFVGGEYNFNILNSAELFGDAFSSLAASLDNPQRLIFATGGDSPWFSQTSTILTNGSAAQSGKIGNSQTSWIDATVTGPGSLSFAWKVSSESSYDYLSFSMDGTWQNEISGEVNWAASSYYIPGGIHTLRWNYSKDESYSDGQDAAWLDQVIFTP